MDDVFLGRQPIFNRSGDVEAYELLFRSSAAMSTSAGMIDGDQATATVLVNTLMNFGLDKVAGGKLLFLNGTHDFLTGSLPELLPPDRVVLEILEDIKPTEEIIAACRKWKEMGFTLALDDFVYSPELQPLVDLADIIKVDISILPDGMAAEIKKLKDVFSGQLLAEKIETSEEHKQAMNLGFHLFQGYFYCKPETMGKKGLDVGQIQAMQVMQKALTAESVQDIEEALARDMSLSYKLLKYINSVGFGLRGQVRSVSHALGLLGLRNIRTWISVVALAAAASDKPPELIKQALIRGRFLELMATAKGENSQKSDYFILGMFSLLDILLDIPMKQAIADLCLPKFVEHGLLLPESQGGVLLAWVVALERGDWQHIATHQYLGKNEKKACDFAAIFVDAVSWADSLSL